MTHNKEVTPDTLSNVMDFGHVIRVHEDGTVSDSPESFYGELSMIETEEGHWEECFELGDGWQLLTGFSGQYSYSGPVMHSSEYIGGRLAEHILETPGDYVSVVVESEDLHEWQVSTFTGTKTCARCGLLPLEAEDSEGTCPNVDSPAGWAVAFKPVKRYGITDKVSGQQLLKDSTEEVFSTEDHAYALRVLASIRHYVGTDYVLVEL